MCCEAVPTILFWIKNKKKIPQFYDIKGGIRGYNFHGHVFLMFLGNANYFFYYPFLQDHTNEKKDKTIKLQKCET